ncbi:hypothetical protein SDC9_91217 [bioreactor metagenome]|uniref:Uncharacterized protein n=1 Tax=bioreactor metagenome TaxID=1076179 RepID=A0A644ZU56_9ZZZZ
MDLRQRVRCHDVDKPVDSQTGRIGIDQQRREPARAGGLFGARNHHIEVGNAAVGDVRLGSVDDVVAPLQRGHRLRRCHVRSTVRLGECKSRHLGAVRAGLYVVRHQRGMALLP